MGRFLAEEDDDQPEVVRNLQRTRQKQSQLTRILSMERADAQTLGQIYLVVVQLVMIQGSDKWILMPHMNWVLGRFHHRVARRLTGRQLRRGQDRGWFYPQMQEAMAQVGLQEAETYVSLCHNTITQYIATRSIMDLCLQIKRSPGPRVETIWWEHKCLYLEGIQTAVRGVEQMEGVDYTDGTEMAMDD